MIGVHIVDGLPYPTFLDIEKYYTTKNLQPRANDIIISTFPKCGTNWTAYILWGILHPDEPTPDSRRVQNDIPFVEFCGLGTWEGSPEDQSRTFFTHFPADRLQVSPKAKYVVTIRNPLDCCVSFYHFWKEHPFLRDNVGESGSLTPEIFFDHFVKGETPWGDFFQHLKSWYDLKNQDNIHVILFEKLKANPRAEVLKLAAFLGHEKKLEADNGKLVDKIVEQSSFPEMKKNFVYKSPIDGTSVPILRKGEVGGYREMLTPRQIEILKNKMEQELVGTEILEFWRNV